MNGSVDRTSSHTVFEAQLPPELGSAMAARCLLAGAITTWQLSEAVGHDAALAVSELVTNAVLHAGTALTIRIKRAGTGVRVEVLDGNPHLPLVAAVRPEDLPANRSMTGRGLALVAATSDRWGCDPLVSGKMTWAEVGTGQGPFDRAPAASDGPVRRGVKDGPDARPAGRRVRLVGVPVAILAESIRQLSDLQREVQVMAMARNAPPELDQVLHTGGAWITDVDLWTDSDRRVAEHAAATGAETVDFDVVVPDDIAEKIDRVTAWLRRVRTSIMRRQLLTLPASDEVMAYRRWYGEEIMHQLAGRKPKPCPLQVRAGAQTGS